MHEPNPYEPPSSSWTGATHASSDLSASSSRRLPLSFWPMWAVMVLLCLVCAVGTRLIPGAAQDVLLAWSLFGLGLAPFIALRAKLCEGYQHRCLNSSGVKIYWSCFGVCLGLAYASFGVLVAFLMLASWLLSSFLGIVPPMGFGLMSLLIVLIPALMLYVYLIHLSAKRPRLEEDNETASDPTH
jgi:hypothetical protein